MKTILRVTMSTVLAVHLVLPRVSDAAPPDKSTVIKVAKIAGAGVGTYLLSRKEPLRPLLASDLLQGIAVGVVSPNNGQPRWDRVLTGYESGLLMASGKRLSVWGINRDFSALPGNAVTATAGSLLENLAGGRPPFSRWSMSFGPVDLEVRRAGQGVKVSPALDLASTIVAARNIANGQKLDLQSTIRAGGTFVFTAPILEKDNTYGQTAGNIITLDETLDDDVKKSTLGHEQTHANQYRTDRYLGLPFETRLRISGKPSWLKMDGMFSGIIGGVHERPFEYAKRRIEAEAFTITDDFYPGIQTGRTLFGSITAQRLPPTFEMALLEKIWNPIHRPDMLEAIAAPGNAGRGTVAIRWRLRPPSKQALDLITSSNDRIVVTGPENREATRDSRGSGIEEFRDLMPGEYSVTVEHRETIGGRRYSKSSKTVRFTVLP